MSVFAIDSLLDASADKLIADGDKIVLLDTYSTVYATVVAGAIGEYVPTITKGDAASNGRVAIVASASVPVTKAGPSTLINYAIVNTTGSEVLLVGEVTLASGAVSSGDTVNMPALNALIIPDLVVGV